MTEVPVLTPTPIPSLNQMLAAFNNYVHNEFPFVDLLMMETAFYLNAPAIQLASYARIVGRGKYRGLHPVFVVQRTDFRKIELGLVTFGGGTWKLVEINGNVKDAEYVLLEHGIETPAETVADELDEPETSYGLLHLALVVCGVEILICFFNLAVNVESRPHLWKLLGACGIGFAVLAMIRRLREDDKCPN